MKHLLFTALVVAAVFAGCSEREKAKERLIYNKEFDWTITIPEDFDTLTPKEWAKIQGRGAEAIEKTYGTEIENNSNTIFVFKNSKFNYFESNWQPYDTAEVSSYEETCQAVNDMIYGTFEAQMPDARLDSASSTETISGLEFRVFKVNIGLPDDKNLECRLYTRLFGNREFSVNITTLDKEKRAALLKAWRGSKFGT
ncbi:MAG TPA: hypothetical protein VGB46_07100 [Flavisolibacter sp.]|jgi:hypothetical protein